MIQHSWCPQLTAVGIDRLDMAERLTRFWQKLDDDSVAVLVSNPERTRSRDTEFPYRQSSDILYLTGFPEPETVVVVAKLGGVQTLVMFVRPKDPVRETWTGKRAGVDGAKRDYLADEAYPVGDFAKEIAKLVKQAKTVYYRFGVNEHFDDEFRKVWQPGQKPLKNPEEILHEMRLFKTAKELDLMRWSSAITAEAHCDAMRACKPGMGEHQLQAVLEYVFRFHGATAPSYNSIVAGGSRATVLHYNDNNKEIVDGDLVLIDAACECGNLGGGYASDITRTFPANGRFSQAQREIYEIVLEAQLAAIAKSKPGVRLADVHDEAKVVMAAGLVRLGLLPASVLDGIKSDIAKANQLVVPTPQAAVVAAMVPAEGAYTPASHWLWRIKNAGQSAPARALLTATEAAPPVTPALNSAGQALPKLEDYFMHGTSHWLGLDVHDVGEYRTADGTRNDRGRGKQRVLEPGMVITVEPGLYFGIDDFRVPPQYRGIGIRIEDDVVITESGNEVITAAVPKTVAEIEKLMAQGRL